MQTSKQVRTLGYYVAFIMLGLTTASLGPTLPGLAEQTRTTLGQISILFSARSFGYLIGSLQGGRWYDRVHGHRLMGLALFALVGTLVFIPLARAGWLLTLLLLALGFAEVLVDVGGNTLLVWLHGREVAPYMNGMHFCFGVGAFLSPVIIAWALARTGDLHWAYWTLALIIAPVPLLLQAFPRPAHHQEADASATGEAPWRLVALIALFFFLYVGGETSCGGWIFSYASALHLADDTHAAYLTSAFWGALTLGRLLAIPLAARLRPRVILRGDLLLCLASVGLILIFPRALPAVWIGACGAGLAMASIFPTTLALAERRMPISGKITGRLFIGASLGGMIIPWVIGQLFEPLGPTVLPAVLMGLILLQLGTLSLILAAPLSQPTGA